MERPKLSELPVKMTRLLRAWRNMQNVMCYEGQVTAVSPELRAQYIREHAMTVRLADDESAKQLAFYQSQAQPHLGTFNDLYQDLVKGWYLHPVRI